MFDLLTLQWFLPKAVVGIILGFAMRAVEHYAWNKQSWVKAGGENDRPSALPFHDALCWGTIVLTQCFAVGIPSAYILLLVLLRMAPSPAVAETLIWLVPIFMSYIAVDIRELLRRVTKV